MTWTPIKNFGDSDINQLYDTLLKIKNVCFRLYTTFNSLLLELGKNSKQIKQTK